MRMRNTLRAAGIVTAAVLVSGCISLTDAQLEAREYRRADFRNQFMDYRQRCLAAGGKIFIDAKQSLDRDGLPHRGDRYLCR